MNHNRALFLTLKDIEIRVGGMVKANFHLNNRGIEAFLDGGEDDYLDSRRKLSFCFVDSSGGLSILVTIGRFLAKRSFEKCKIWTPRSWCMTTLYVVG